MMENTAEQRDWSRFESVGKIDVLVSVGPCLSGRLRNKSLGGIGVFVRDVSKVSLGQTVTVVYYEAPVQATVVRVDEVADGLWELGLQWNYEDCAASQAAVLPQ